MVPVRMVTKLIMRLKMIFVSVRQVVVITTLEVIKLSFKTLMPTDQFYLMDAQKEREYGDFFGTHIPIATCGYATATNGIKIVVTQF